MTTLSLTGTCHCCGSEVELEIEADVSPVIPGRYSGPPENCYPDEGGEVEVVSCTLDGRDVDPAAFGLDEQTIADAAREAADEEDGEARAAADEARADARADRYIDEWDR